jgi:acetyl esterase/lipase
MIIRRWFKRLAVATLGVLAFLVAVAGYGWWYYHPTFDRTDGVVYGHRGEKPLTMDILRPPQPNGKAVAFMVSGGWKSKGPGESPAWLMAPLLRRGYTIFAVCHISQPDATIMEIIEDMHRSIRFIRHHADEYGIDPNKIGVTGGSAGGHLSLMLATRGGPGDPDAADPVDRQRSDVQAVAIFYPVTDLLDMTGSTEDTGDGGPPKSFVKGFGPEATNMESWKKIGRDCSPIYFLTDKLPPTLIYHGDADTLVPLIQSQRFRDSAVAIDRNVKLVVHPGGSHGWWSMFWDIERFGDWFDTYLK